MTDTTITEDLLAEGGGSRVGSGPARNFLSGAWQESGTVDIATSPADGRELGSFYSADESQVAAAIASAKATFSQSGWRYDRELRARVLNEMADLVEQHTDELARMLAIENGKVLGEAYFELSLTPSKLRYYAAQALVDSGRGGRPKAGMYSLLLPEAVGVAGVIVPWNSPVVLSVRSFAPALAAGCTVVVKMAAQTGLVNARLAELLASAPSLPEGVYHQFTESGDAGARLLVSSPDIAALSYTGSTRVGRTIMANAAPTLKRLSLELGGKTPMVVFDDANLDAAVGTIRAGVTTFAGQFCMTGSRVLVQRGVADQVRERLVAALESVVVGPGDAEGSDMGPMIDIANCERLDAILEEHLGNGATALVRGGRPADAELADGAYYRPALIEVSDNFSPLIQQELFGPVATFQVFDTEEELVSLVNDNEYGLAASIWTSDGSRGLRMAEQIEAGTVWVNGWAAVVDQFEEGGFKQSGLGRLNGHRAVEEFQEYKHVVQFTG